MASNHFWLLVALAVHCRTMSSSLLKVALIVANFEEQSDCMHSKSPIGGESQTGLQLHLLW